MRIFMTSIWAVFLLVCWALTGCSGRTIIMCPDGTVFSNGLCCPVGSFGQGSTCLLTPEDVAPDQGSEVSDSTTTPPGDTTTATETIEDQTSTDMGSLDSGTKDIPSFPGHIGDPCSNDLDCSDGAICISWPNGYCAILGCQDNPSVCPEGSQCTSIGATGACLKTCEEETPCRTDDSQFCKSLPVGAGELVDVCHLSEPDAAPLGAPCGIHENCADTTACYSGVPGGMCVINGCNPTSCGDDAACLMLDGLPRCVPTCTTAEDCISTPELERSCEEREDVTGTETNVCFVPQGTEPIGTPCVGGYICDSGFCRITATGVCSLEPDKPCSGSNDCPPGQVCNIAPAFHQGVCSAECSYTDTSACVNGALCAAADDAMGYCSATCEGPDDPNCDPSNALHCLYGLPLGSVAEKYLCVTVTTTGPLTACEETSDCGSTGLCIRSADNTAGYCGVPCAADGQCPFPGICVQSPAGAGAHCYRSCNSANECPDPMQCAFPEGATHRACIP